ncbi:MAG: hypothetical protein LBT49_05285 [Prevotellaceae bacterium]|jgi:hypothetical protein|nr:hypothetical protein [Prevotellaceae bacterium]
MTKKHFIKLMVTALAVLFITDSKIYAQGSGIATGLPAPSSVYCNWSAYDELSDSVRLTEALAMRELNEILRLRKQGVRIDYYLMDAFWFDPDGGYRTWRKGDWINGPDHWLETCKANNIKPGLWFATNKLILLNSIPEWESSFVPDRRSFCFFEGNYLNHLSETLQQYADKGVKLFKFDFADFDAATEHAKQQFTKKEIVEKNQQAFIQAMKNFRSKNPDVVIIAYNGFGGHQSNTVTPFPQTVDLRWRWLEIFDAMYCGDPRLSDMPMMNFWRSKDLYTDHMVRQYVYNGVPLSRIDNFSALLGTTGTCYKRGITAWKGTVILSYARGSWLNSYNGNLELLSDADAAWLAHVQRTYMQLQQFGHTTVWGEIPGTGNPYGYRSESMEGSLFTVVNPGHGFREIDLSDYTNGRILFHDKGFQPTIRDAKLLLGPEQMAVIGFGKYASEEYNLGIENDVIIPEKSELLSTEITNIDAHSALVRVNPAQNRYIQIFLTQCDEHGNPRRSWGGAPPNGTSMGKLLTLSAKQGKKNIPVRIEYDIMVWSGLSWAAGEIDVANIDPKKPLEITCTAKNGEAQYFKIEVYGVDRQN